MRHVVLLGDSILDNGAYTDGGPDVVAQLRAALPAGDRATLVAVDGATTAGIPAQLARVPRDATHLVLSVGGNDALGHVGLLEEPARTVGGALLAVDHVLARFRQDYERALDLVVARGLPTLACTIYDGHFPDRDFQRMARVMAALFGDAIRRAADVRGARVLDLRPVVHRPEHYANPIEPASPGGERIARAIVDALTGA
jgi:hypothetical protein